MTFPDRHVSNRAFVREGLVERMNRELVPMVRDIVRNLADLGFPISATLTERAITEEGLYAFTSKELLPVLHGVFSQTNAMSSAQVVGLLGSRVPTTPEQTVVWLNKNILPKLQIARRVVIIASEEG